MVNAYAGQGLQSRHAAGLHRMQHGEQCSRATAILPRVSRSVRWNTVRAARQAQGCVQAWKPVSGNPLQQGVLQPLHPVLCSDSTPVHAVLQPWQSRGRHGGALLTETPLLSSQRACTAETPFVRRAKARRRPLRSPQQLQVNTRAAAATAIVARSHLPSHPCAVCHATQRRRQPCLQHSVRSAMLPQQCGCHRLPKRNPKEVHPAVPAASSRGGDSEPGLLPEQRTQLRSPEGDPGVAAGPNGTPVVLGLGSDHADVGNGTGGLQQEALPYPPRGTGSSGGEAARKLAEAERLLRHAQEVDDGEVYSLEDTQRLVETAMLAAVGGLAYALSSVLRVQSYFAYLLPMPVVVAAVRQGAGAGRKTCVATAILLTVLLGPIQAATYLLNYGIMAAVLGAMWRWRSPWWASLPAGTLVRVAGTLAYLALSSWTFNENMFVLVLNNVYSLVDRLSGMMGLAGSPSPLFITIFLLSGVTVNAGIYVLLTHGIYAVLLRSLGYPSIVRLPGPLDGFVSRVTGQPQGAT